MIVQLVRLAQIHSPTDVADITLGYATFTDMQIPNQGAVLVDGIFYNIAGFTLEITTGTPEDPGRAQFALKVVRAGGLVTAPAVALDIIKKELPVKS